MKKFFGVKIFFFAVLVILNILICKDVQASTNNVSGWAWSENIGWISFNCDNQSKSYVSWNDSTGIMSGSAWSDNIGWVSFNCDDVNVCSTTNQFCAVDADCPGSETCVDTRDGCALISNYKVTIDTTTGELSGYAWSDSVGWMSFNRSDTGAPPGSPYNSSETYIAKKVGTKITGWGKFLSASNGWDGWVKFACDDSECSSSDYSVYASGNNFYGYAWGSDTVGWLAFGSGCETDYGVNINEEDHTLSGYAWSENVGWLSFNRSDTDVPPAAPFNGAESYVAKFDNTACKLQGWGRFLAHDDGWDGWVKLQREGGSPDYGVSLDSSVNEFTGWAWAGSPSISEGVVGWVSFNNNYGGGSGLIDYQVTTTLSSACGPSVSDTAEIWSYCTDSRHPVLSWTCSETQTGRQIQVKDKGISATCGDVDFSSGLLEDVTDASSSTSYTTVYNYSLNTNYCWRVKCQSASGWSNWLVNSDGFATPQNAYPAPDFTWSPETLRTNEISSFYDDVDYSASVYSKCYNSSDQVIPCTSRTWTFEAATSCCLCSNEECSDNACLDDDDTCSKQGTSADPVGVNWKTRPADGVATVTLQVCDANPYCCSKSYDITTMRYPKWREIIPW